MQFYTAKQAAKCSKVEVSRSAGALKSMDGFEQNFLYPGGTGYSASSSVEPRKQPRARENVTYPAMKTTHNQRFPHCPNSKTNFPLVGLSLQRNRLSNANPRVDISKPCTGQFGPGVLDGQSQCGEVTDVLIGGLHLRRVES